MKRVASLYLPDWSIERLRRMTQIDTSMSRRPDVARPNSAAISHGDEGGRRREALSGDTGFGRGATPLEKAAAAERAETCSVPRGGGWRPGARWAREDVEAQIAALPAHQRPPFRDLGRRSEAAAPPFRAMRADEATGGQPFRPAGSVPKSLGPDPRSMAGHPDSSGRETLQRPRLRDIAVPERPTPVRHSGEDRPLVTSIKQGSRLVIAAACAGARALGLAPGMAITQARALVPELDIRDADPAGDAADLLRLAITAARRWTPLTALSTTDGGDADGLMLDITGSAHLFGGEARMAQRIVRLLGRLGFTARIAVADTAGAAWAMARFGGRGCSIVPPTRHVEAIAGLPLAALRLDAGAVDALVHLGVNTIGQLVAMPRAPLVRRFGDALVTRIDQASGRVAEPLDPVVPPEPILVEQRFMEPIATAEAIAHWLGVLMPRLVTALAQVGQGARRIELVADRIDGIPQRLHIGLARPSRDGAHMLRLITRRIEEIAPGYGIDALALHVRRADRLDAQPFDERLEDRPADLAPLVDTLANRIGDARLWRMRAVESDVPERSLAPAPPMSEAPRAGPRLKSDDIRQLDRGVDLHPWHPRWPRPARLLRRPEQLDHVIAELPDQPPRRFTWRGQTHRIVRADGPERILGEWWHRTAEAQLVRDYFQVEDEIGHRFWLFRRGDGERAETGDLAWFIHGAFG
ncbi:Y-family DNA polymerase [Sphingomonas sp. BAUL-RG-20F-R05-02]|uniref:Y-family DNA polymerase n=1 Tax=Sphingomonas sp. BAUL-RG-20F-R05-02 TaxID=2914830 RepID=UPI001F576463|nr:DNA polymerase Y family protein [Sphingomonas sp. BAUL-RG-20F-R05-02]